MRIEQYFLVTDYSFCEVILNGNSPAPIRVIEGVVQPVAHTTAEQRLARKNKLKAHGTLLMALLDKHQLKFNIHKDAKTLMEAIEKRLQKLISQLEILGESLSQEDINLKFLRSLPIEWRTHTLIWRNKTNLEEQNLDDLFNNLKIYKAEVKSSSSASTSTQNIAFVSSQTTDSTNNQVSVVASVSAASAKIPVSALPNQIDADDLEEIDLKWQMAMLTSFQEEEEPTNYALMAFTSLSSSSFDNKTDESLPHSPIYDRYHSRDGYHAVRPPYTGSFMPPKPDLVFHDAPNVNETDHPAFNVELSPTKPDKDLSYTLRPSAPIIEDWVSDSKDDSEAEIPQNAPIVLTRSKLVPLTAARPVTAAVPKPHVTRPRQAKIVVTKPYSPPRRTINHSSSLKTSTFPLKVTAARASMVNVVKGVQGNWGNPQHALKEKGVRDSRCSRHMTWNMSYLSDFEELNGGYVAFGGNPKGGKISCKGENQMLLRVPMENNMYNVDLKNIVPSGYSTCLFAKATLDESNLWHRRLGHINFKTMNKLVK
nr:ribonuclease H-like domain-containing protein [Tanacetum cinerariifolium]